MRRHTVAVLGAALVIAVTAAPAFATNGYFAHGYGTHYKAMAGAGAALSLDAIAPATKPRRDGPPRPALRRELPRAEEARAARAS